MALMAARSGIGKLTLIDPETLALENVGRHMLSRGDVGKPKAQALREQILAVNPRCEVEARHERFHDNMFQRVPFPHLNFDVCSKGFAFPGPPLQYVGIKKSVRANPNGKPDLIASCADSFACESMINDYSLRENVPAIYGGCWGEASVGEILYVVPGRTPCYECFARFRRDQVEIPDDSRKYTDPEFDATKVPGQAGLWANILIITGVMFQLVLALLDPESDRTALIDYEHTLSLVNVSKYDAVLQPLAVSFGIVKKGCNICSSSVELHSSAELLEIARSIEAVPVGDEPSETIDVPALE